MIEIALNTLKDSSILPDNIYKMLNTEIEYKYDVKSNTLCFVSDKYFASEAEVFFGNWFLWLGW